MCSVQKKVIALLVVAVMVTVVLTTKSDKFRFKVKQVLVCSGKELTIIPRDIKTSYKQKGKIFVVNTNFDAKEDTDLKTYNIQVFKDAVPPYKLVSFEGNDFCAKLMEGKCSYLEPVFAAGQLPRNCTVKKGVYPLKAELDLVFEGGKLPDTAKGRYNYKYEYGDGTKVTLCVTGYGDLEKE